MLIQQYIRQYVCDCLGKNARTRFVPLLFLAMLFVCDVVRAENGVHGKSLAEQVTIHRDEWGVPHIDGATDASAAFGFAYAQAEDYFWQVEDSYLQSIGRYAEAVGEKGLKSDLLNHNFQIAERSKLDFAERPEKTRELCTAFAAGLNYYLETHPEVETRVIERYEPWMVVAFGRYTMLTWTFGRTGAKMGEQDKLLRSWDEGTGSNLWAIGPTRTKDETTMLFVNPHQPWFGGGQFWEGHLRSAEGWNMSGSCFFGTPFPTMGHNENLGWTHTANQPDLGEAYRLTFDDPNNPLNYQYDGGYRTATQRNTTIRVKTKDGVEERTHQFRMTHLGPIVAQEDENTYLACKIARLFEGDRIGQGYRMGRAENFDEFYTALSELSLLMFNVGYADREGNIAYIYNGAIPVRDAKGSWGGTVDGSKPGSEWKSIHPLEELPQVVNPPTGYVQNCNQSPFSTTDGGGPYKGDYPSYMVQESRYDNRRAQVSRHHLRDMNDVTFDEWKEAVVDTTMLWPKTELPRFARQFRRLMKKKPKLAERVGPYFRHLQDWDYINRVGCTQSTLVLAWYEEMYGGLNISQKLKPEFKARPAAKFEALITAAEKLKAIHGSWKVPYDSVYRIQRHINIGDYRDTLFAFRDKLPSVPCLGSPGPLGASYNVYYSPSTKMRKRRYGAVGGSFMAAYEFGEKIKAVSLIQFGQSADPASPHYFDQAELYSKKQFKPAWFYWDDVLAHTKESYRPGERS